MMTTFLALLGAYALATSSSSESARPQQAAARDSRRDRGDLQQPRRRDPRGEEDRARPRAGDARRAPTVTPRRSMNAALAKLDAEPAREGRRRGGRGARLAAGQRGRQLGRRDPQAPARRRLPPQRGRRGAGHLRRGLRDRQQGGQEGLPRLGRRDRQDGRRPRRPPASPPSGTRSRRPGASSPRAGSSDGEARLAAALPRAAALAGCGDGGGARGRAQPADAGAAARASASPTSRRRPGLTRVIFAGRPGEGPPPRLGRRRVRLARLRPRRPPRRLRRQRVEDRRRSVVVERGRNALYRNRGDGTFEDVTDRAGVGGDGRWGTGVAVADYDGDGWPDLFVTAFGPNALYRNRGDGTFEEVAAQAGVACPGWNTGACFFDADGDGHLDLYVAAYIACTIEDVLGARRTLEWKGVADVAFGPFGLKRRARPLLQVRRERRVRATRRRRSGMTDRALAFGFSVRGVGLRPGRRPRPLRRERLGRELPLPERRQGPLRGGRALVGVRSRQERRGPGGHGRSPSATPNEDGRPDVFVTNFAEDFIDALPRRPEAGSSRTRASRAASAPRPTFRCRGARRSPTSTATATSTWSVANGHIYPQVDEFPAQGQTYAQRDAAPRERRKGPLRRRLRSRRSGVPRERRRTAGSPPATTTTTATSTCSSPASTRRPLLLRNDSARGNWLTVACAVAGGRRHRIVGHARRGARGRSACSRAT